MLRLLVFKSAVGLRAPILFPALSRATFVTSARVMSEGDTGAPPKRGGQGDAFQRRERAAEDYAIREREKEKLLGIKRRIQEQKEHLRKLEEHIDEITKDQGGEQN